MKRCIAYAGVLTVLAGSANIACAADSSDDSLTWFGVTLYGTVDIGYTYQNRGVPLNDYFPAGLEYLIQKNQSKKISTLSENAMSQSKVGLRGTHEFFQGWSGIFKLEVGFNPLSGNLTDGPKSVAQNNGVPAVNQNTNGDSSRAGQAFQGAAYGGVSSPIWGTLTIGRQNSLLFDNVLKYDPLGGSYAFSVIGYSGTAPGGGDTQDTRLDNSIKYLNQIGMFRFGAQFQSGLGTGSGGNAIEADVGGDFLPGLSVDAAYANKKGAILVAPLGVPVKTCPAKPSSAINCIPSTISPDTGLAATVSDNRTWSFDASYLWQAFKFSAGYENIQFRNPQVPLAAGAQDIGGYTLAFVNNDAYPNGAKIIQVMWAGVKYSFGQRLDLYGAWYHYGQNNYNSLAHCPGGVSDAAQCSGREDAWSLVADYKFNRHFDVYGGAMYSHLADGLASDSLTTFTVDPTIGFRFNF